MDSPLKVFPEHEQKFHKLFYEFINTFNSFDRKIGLCLGWVVTGGHPHMAYPLIEKLTTHGKIDSLTKILKSEAFKDQKHIVDEFNQWIKRALKVKSIRNNYIRANWEILFRNDSYKFIHYYDASLSVPSNSHNLTVSEFEDIVTNLQKITEDFGQLYKKHLQPYTGGRTIPVQNTLT